MNSAERDERWMAEACRIARCEPARPFAALVVDRRMGAVVASGLNRVDGGPIWHGEMDALRDLDVPRTERRHLVLYSTAEPCCMCMGAILWTGIPRVVFGTGIPKLVEFGYGQIHIPAAEVTTRHSLSSCEVVGGVGVQTTDQLFKEASRLRVDGAADRAGSTVVDASQSVDTDQPMPSSRSR